MGSPLKKLEVKHIIIKLLAFLSSHCGIEGCFPLLEYIKVGSLELTSWLIVWTPGSDTGEPIWVSFLFSPLNPSSMVIVSCEI